MNNTWNSMADDIIEYQNNIVENYNNLSKKWKKEYWLNMVVTFFFDKNSNTSNQKIDIISLRKTYSDIDLYIVDMINEVSEQWWISYEEAKEAFILDETYNEEGIDNKVKYWAWIFFITLRENKINISEYRKLEPNIDLMLNDIIKEIFELSWYQTREEVIENYFILDEQAKKALEVYNTIFWNSNKIDETLKKAKTESIEWVEISFEELAERIWDLYYDALSSFLDNLSENIDNNEIKRLLSEASWSISIAWDICKPAVEEFIKNWWEVWKHTSEVKWLNIDKKELAEKIWNLVDSQLSKFLEKLSKKMQKDWEADEWRKRYKLANELYTCAGKLKKASESL